MIRPAKADAISNTSTDIPTITGTKFVSPLLLSPPLAAFTDSFFFFLSMSISLSGDLVDFSVVSVVTSRGCCEVGLTDDALLSGLLVLRCVVNTDTGSDPDTSLLVVAVKGSTVCVSLTGRVTGDMVQAVAGRTVVMSGESVSEGWISVM